MVIGEELYRQIITQLRETFPDEACGLIAADGDKAVQVFPIANVSESPVIFVMHPQQQLDALDEIEDRGWRLGAIYHSHTRTRAYPSKTDIDLAFYPEALQMIISLADFDHPDAHIFRVAEGRVTEETLQIVPTNG